MYIMENNKLNKSFFSKFLNFIKILINPIKYIREKKKNLRMIFTHFGN